MYCSKKGSKSATATAGRNTRRASSRSARFSRLAPYCTYYASLRSWGMPLARPTGLGLDGPGHRELLGRRHAGLPHRAHLPRPRSCRARVTTAWRDDQRTSCVSLAVLRPIGTMLLGCSGFYGCWIVWMHSFAWRCRRFLGPAWAAACGGLMIMWTFSASQSKDQQPIVFAGFLLPKCRGDRCWERMAGVAKGARVQLNQRRALRPTHAGLHARFHGLAKSKSKRLDQT